MSQMGAVDQGRDLERLAGGLTEGHLRREPLQPVVAQGQQPNF
jgi:hypothetical protein